jgi:hypothetical protein
VVFESLITTEVNHGHEIQLTFVSIMGAQTIHVVMARFFQELP